jgi:hypothetical protein
VRAFSQRQTLDGTRARAQGFKDGLHAEDVRAVVRRILTASGLARLVRTFERRTLALCAARRTLAPVIAREGARHALARRLVAAFGSAPALICAATRPALLSPVLFHVLSARARSISRWRSRA